MTQEISIVLGACVGRIFQPTQTVLFSVCQQRRTTDIEQRPQQRYVAQQRPLRHRGQALGTGATHELQQQGFRLIVLMMRGQQHAAFRYRIDQRLITCGASRRLRTFTGLSVRLYRQ